VNVVSPGSLAFAVNTISLHSFPVLLTASAVGSTLFHFAAFIALHVQLHCPSLTFTYTLYVPDSFNVCLYVLPVSHAIAVVHVEFVYHA
jgi:hypothetical protein